MTLAPTQGFTLFVLVTVAGTACEHKSKTCLALELTESEVGLVLQQSTAVLLEQRGKDGTYLTTSQFQREEQKLITRVEGKICGPQEK